MSVTLSSVAYNLSDSEKWNLKYIYESTQADEKIIIDTGGNFDCDFATVIRSTHNLYYGPAIKFAAKNSTCDNFVYLSANRSKMVDPSWIDDIVGPLIDARCGMAGCLQQCEYNRIARHPTDIFDPQIHIQGGVFSIRKEVMDLIDYGKFPQIYSDVYISWQLVRMGYFLADIKSIKSSAGGMSSVGKIRVGYPDRDLRKKMFDELSNTKSDINEHLSTLRSYAGRSSRVVEFGTRGGVSTLAMLDGQPDSLVTVDIDKKLVNVDHIYECVGDTKFSSLIASSLEYKIEACDLLFIDTDHNYQQLSAELNLHNKSVTRWIIMHDTESYPECKLAVKDFLSENKEFWKELVHYANNNGLTILERIK
jgi:hypothetical protein